MDEKRYLVARIGRAEQFKPWPGQESDDRVGKWMVDVYLVYVNGQGDTIEYAGSKLEDVRGWVDFSGLWENFYGAYSSALQSARAAVRALRLVGKAAWIWDSSRPITEWSDSFMDLGAHLMEQAQAAERKAKQQALREQARALMEEARAL